MTDQQIYEKFCLYGQQALDARNKCIGLLPEIFKREIFRQHGFQSIFEFAAKVAGLSHEQVKLTLNLEKRLVDKPALHKALVKGEISVNKLAKIVSIATLENQAELTESIKKLSVRAVETMVRDRKNTEGLHVHTQSAMFLGSIQAQETDLQLDPIIKDQLLDMQKKGIDINNALQKFLQNYQQEVEKEKTAIGEIAPENAGRYVPVGCLRVLKKEFGTQCSVPGCSKSFSEIHHLIPYAISQKHDPRLMVQLCQEHHQIVHRVNFKVGSYALQQ